jgi:hypothetical protein
LGLLKSGAVGIGWCVGTTFFGGFFAFDEVDFTTDAGVVAEAAGEGAAAGGGEMSILLFFADSLLCSESDDSEPRERLSLMPSSLFAGLLLFKPSALASVALEDDKDDDSDSASSAVLHCLHLERILSCSQMKPPPQSLQTERIFLCSQPFP